MLLSRGAVGFQLLTRRLAVEVRLCRLTYWLAVKVCPCWHVFSLLAEPGTLHYRDLSTGRCGAERFFTPWRTMETMWPLTKAIWLSMPLPGTSQCAA